MAIRRIEARERIMARNDALAAKVRERIEHLGMAALNLISSPGSGKTTLLERTLDAVGEELGLAIVAGDVQTINDAERLTRHTGRLVQAVVTDGACHLDAAQMAEALAAVDPASTRLLIVENVGNLVCPASWDLGETATVVLFSTTEGEDKPLKYPKAFQRAAYLVLTKIDLLPYLPFDADQAIANARRVNPDLTVLRLSARTGEGMDRWYETLRALVPARVSGAMAGSPAAGVAP